MTQFVIEGGKPLKGTVKVSGAKNAALKMIAASILATKPITLSNVPRISDVEVMVSLVSDFGITSAWQGNHTLILDPKNIHPANPSPALVKKLRASVVLIGPALARFGSIKLPTPGGDHIGKRPIETHLNALRQLGATVEKQGELLEIKGKLNSNNVFLNEMSVTATENTLLASALTPGQTTIHVAATEPEITNLAELLISMGAKITGAGSPTITIQGVSTLAGGSVNIIPDRIEASTLLLAGIITGGNVTIENVEPKFLANFIPTILRMGVNLTTTKNSISITSPNNLKAISIDTRPYPGFSTDLQSPLAAALTQARGKSHIFETLFENRFNYVDELNKMGAKIKNTEPHAITINGPTQLKGANLTASHDIRAAGALVLAGLSAQGKTTIQGVDVIDRGYEKLDQKLKKLGANIERVES